MQHDAYHMLAIIFPSESTFATLAPDNDEHSIPSVVRMYSLIKLILLFSQLKPYLL
jgi:hypothetical protein